jgi:hypothetical protein
VSCGRGPGQRDVSDCPENHNNNNNNNNNINKDINNNNSNINNNTNNNINNNINIETNGVPEIVALRALLCLLIQTTRDPHVVCTCFLQTRTRFFSSSSSFFASIRRFTPNIGL